MATAVVGCARLSTDHAPVFHTPLADAVYIPDPFPEMGREQRLDALRQTALTFVDTLLNSSHKTNDFGEKDIADLLVRLHVRISWSADKGIVALARETRRQRAYAADGKPLPGDIVLFHNQRDMNDNGENDDWLTGCGIVTHSDGGRFEAVVRTGHLPRRIVVTPLVPSTREENGKIINSFVRIPSRYDPKGTEYLAGQLYAGHIDIEKLPIRR